MFIQPSPLAPAAVVSVPRPSSRFAPGLSRVAPRPRSRWSALERLFWVGLASVIVFTVYNSLSQSFESLIGALLVILAAMLPSYLWIRGKVRGLPLFPACALTYLWTFAFPLVSEQRFIVLFPGWNQLVAGFSVAGFLALGTLSWFLVARRPSRPLSVCWSMNETNCAPWLLIALGGCVLWTMAYTAGWIRLPGGLDSIARAVQMPTEVLACFVLSYRLGSGKLVGGSRVAFLALLPLLLLAHLPPLQMFVSMSLAAAAMIAYVASARRLPWLAGIVVLTGFGYLHLGKAEMRERHWQTVAQQDPVAPWQYPAFLTEWVTVSWNVVQHGDNADEHSDSLLERASLMHWLLYFEASSPRNIPFLNGATYAIIPRLLVPRFIDPDKPLSTEGITLVGEHYGIVTREDAEVVTVGFGLLNEAFANFGYLGIAGLAVVLGAFYAQVSRWARGVPVLSLRGLFAVSIANYAIQTEYSASFYVTSFTQSTAVLLALTLLFMRPQRFSGANTSLLD